MTRHHWNRRRGARAALLVSLAVAGVRAPRAIGAYPTGYEITDRDAAGQLTLRLSNFITAPHTNNAGSSDQTKAQVARINFVRQEPIPTLASQRLFMNDLNGNVYIYNRSADTFTTYLNFNTLFAGKFDTDPGFAAGVVTLQFDPDYANNGKFYTVHTELPAGGGTAFRDAVIEEWHDTNINNTTFEGTRAELYRVSNYANNIHPVGDISFNPLATDSSKPDWRNMYISSGDGSAGESGTTSTRVKDQMLNNPLGKVLRITPSATGTPGTYTVPADNPFTGAQFSGASPEVYAYGFRNPHRMSWDVDRTDPLHPVARLFVDDIGLHSYEELNLVKPGANYGYSTLEGPQVLESNTGTTNFNHVNNNPLPGTLPIYTNTTASNVGQITPTYPLTAYSHEDGDAITSGFVYRGTRIPELVGKYVFGDITTGRLFYCNLSDLLAADDGNPATEAPIHEFRVLFSSPYDNLGPLKRRVFDIVRDEFDRRNDTALGTRLHNGTITGVSLPGSADATQNGVIDPYGLAYTGGRSDIRWTLIDNELYLISKSDGMIRAVTAPLYGDANDDSIVNALDFNVLASHYGQSNQTWITGDFNQDGFVNALDFNALSNNFNHTALPAAALGSPLVPEPALISILAFASFSFGRPRRR